jgi:plastocyanin
MAWRSGLALSFAAAVLAAGASQAGSAAPAASAKTYTIVIDKMKFGPVPAGLRVGDTILWANRDIFRHTATARDGSFDIDLPPAKSGRTVLKRAGSVPFWCRFHPGMKGQLIISR